MSASERKQSLQDKTAHQEMSELMTFLAIYTCTPAPSPTDDIAKYINAFKKICVDKLDALNLLQEKLKAQEAKQNNLFTEHETLIKQFSETQKEKPSKKRDDALQQIQENINKNTQELAALHTDMQRMQATFTAKVNKAYLLFSNLFRDWNPDYPLQSEISYLHERYHERLKSITAFIHDEYAAFIRLIKNILRTNLKNLLTLTTQPSCRKGLFNISDSTINTLCKIERYMFLTQDSALTQVQTILNMLNTEMRSIAKTPDGREINFTQTRFEQLVKDKKPADILCGIIYIPISAVYNGTHSLQQNYELIFQAINRIDAELTSAQTQEKMENGDYTINLQPTTALEEVDLSQPREQKYNP